MKSLMQLLFVFLQLHLFSQPVLKPAFYLADLPDLKSEQLINRSDVICYEHPEGILLYNEKDDQWRLFKSLSGFEYLGKITKLFTLNKITIVSMERGSVLISNDDIKTLNYSIRGGIAKGDSLLFVSSTYSKNSNNTESYLINYQINSDSLALIKLSGLLSGIKSVHFVNGSFYLLILNEGGDGTWSGIAKASMGGKVTYLTGYGHEFGQMHILQSFNNKLYLQTSSGIFKISHSDSLIKVWENTSDLMGIKSNYRNYMYLVSNFNYRSDKIEINRLSLEDFSILSSEIDIPDSWHLSYGTEAQVFDERLFLNSELTSTIYGSGLDKKVTKKRYNFRDGITGPIHFVAEDSTEVWFVSGRSGIIRYSKADSSWTTYVEYMDIPIDPEENYRIQKVSLNDDYVFFTMQNKNGHILKYLIFDRKTEFFNLMSEEEFVNKFFFSEGKFSKYNGKEFMSKEDFVKFEQLFNKQNKWVMLLFLYDLPLSGVDVYDHRNLIIQKPDYSILSIWAHSSFTNWYKGVLVKSKNDNSIKIFKYPKSISDFYSGIVPYNIYGNNNKIYVAGRGNSSKGIFSYNFENQNCTSDPQWFKAFQDISRVAVADSFLVIGSYERRLHLLNRETNQITDFSNLKKGSPRGILKSNTYLYVSTEYETICFDLSFKNHWKLYSGQATLYKTDFGIYLSNHEKVYKVVEE